MVGLLDALGIERAVIAGHDWGASVAWVAAQLRPDRFPAVAVWYQLYFQEPGVVQRDTAIAAMREAADLDDASEKNVAMENKVVPIRALLGDLYLAAFGLRHDGRRPHRTARPERHAQCNERLIIPLCRLYGAVFAGRSRGPCERSETVRHDLLRRLEFNQRLFAHPTRRAPVGDIGTTSLHR